MKWFGLFINIAFMVCVNFVIYDYGRLAHQHILWTIVMMLALTTSLGSQAWYEFRDHDIINMIIKLDKTKENEDGTRN